MAPASGWEQWVGRAEASPAPQHDPPHRTAGYTLDAGQLAPPWLQARRSRHDASGRGCRAGCGPATSGVRLVDHLHLAAAVALDAQEPRGERGERLVHGLGAGRERPRCRSSSSAAWAGSWRPTRASCATAARRLRPCRHVQTQRRRAMLPASRCGAVVVVWRTAQPSAAYRPETEGHPGTPALRLAPLTTAAGCPATSPRSPCGRCRSSSSGTAGWSAARHRGLRR